MIREMFLLTHLKQNPLLTLEIREHLLNIFDSFIKIRSLEGKFLKNEVPKDKFNHLTKGERMSYVILRITVLIRAQQLLYEKERTILRKQKTNLEIARYMKRSQTGLSP